MPDQTPVLECKDLCISYFTRAGEIPAVVDFNLTVMPGEAVGIVGESGCGKSTVALAIMQYMGKNGRVMSGDIKFKGRDMTKMSDGLSGADGFLEPVDEDRAAAHGGAAVS
jgi:peptide/nickel transport system ATP-binding protein